MRHYDTLFDALSQPIAQVLLTADCLGSRSGYLNAKATFESLLELGVVPIVNENDTVAVNELRFGDNDTLSALVATLVGGALPTPPTHGRLTGSSDLQWLDACIRLTSPTRA